MSNSPELLQLEQTKFYFWKYLNQEQRHEVFAALGVLPPKLPQGPTFGIEMLAVKAIIRKRKLTEFWDLIMTYVPKSRRVPNPFREGNIP